MKKINLEKYNFECIKCGDCCYQVVQPFQMMKSIYSYDIKGNLVLNPYTSVSVHFLEKPPLERKIQEEFNLNSRFYPQIVFFLKDFPIGFINSYQIGVKKKKFCMFYDLKERKCKIYSIRPAVCRYFPLHPSYDDLTVPRMKLLCKALLNELNNQFSTVKIEEFTGEGAENAIKTSFPLEYLVFKNTTAIWAQIDFCYLKHLKHIFIDPEKITPEEIKGYQLRDFRDLINWALLNLEKPEDRQKVRALIEDLTRFNIIS